MHNKAVQTDNLRAVRLVVSLSLNFTTRRTAHKLRLTAALSEKNGSSIHMRIGSREQLQECIAQGKKVKYVFFWGHTVSGSAVTKACFSQWYSSPFEV